MRSLSPVCMTPTQSYFLLIFLTYRYFLTQGLSVVFTYRVSHSHKTASNKPTDMYSTSKAV